MTIYHPVNEYPYRDPDPNQPLGVDGGASGDAPELTTPAIPRNEPDDLPILSLEGHSAR